MGAPNLTRTDARRRAELLDVTAYEVELDLTDGAGKPALRTFRSRTTVRFRARRVGAGTFADLIADGIREATLNGIVLDTSGYAPESGLVLQPSPRTTHWSSTPTASIRIPGRACTDLSIRSIAPSICTRNSRPPMPSGCTPALTSRTSRRRSR